jgi:diaminopimelate epimerase
VTTRTTLKVVKGHGTENDFIIVADLQGELSLTPSFVRALTDRHAGIGADGILRVMRTEYATEPAVRDQAAVAPFFMDYCNADGSTAEMCGNGVRVFARFLQRAGLVDGPFQLATRGGTRSVDFIGDLVSVDMGHACGLEPKPTVTVPGMLAAQVGVALAVPNPHVVVELDSESVLDELDLSRAPVVLPSLPAGQNVEFVVRTGDQAIRMRVHERGVGETRSCGTGICAAVAVIAADDLTGRWTVDVPGGRCQVTWTATGSMVLSGPAVLVADVEIDLQWLTANE